jgi:hypothetical protein
MVSNPTQGMDICVCVFYVFGLFCVLVGALCVADLSSKESYRLFVDEETVEATKFHKGCKAVNM